MYYHPSAQPMKSIPFFRAGRHLDSRGRQVEFSEADLDAAIAGYDPALHRAPLVIGHPKDNGPAYGWVGSISRNSKGEAVATPVQLHNDFAEGVAAGTWYPRSASWYAPTDPRNPKPGVYYLRHIGFLGAQPPAIKGLSDIEFDDGEGVVEIEFSDFGHEVGASLWRKFREWLIGERGIETADKVAPSWEIDSLAEAGHRDEPRSPAFSDPTPTTTEESPVDEAQAAALKAENERLQRELKQHQGRAAGLRAQESPRRQRRVRRGADQGRTPAAQACRRAGRSPGLRRGRRAAPGVRRGGCPPASCHRPQGDLHRSAQAARLRRTSQQGTPGIQPPSG
ncbi:peptidase [Pseudomonas aeruginosa]